MKKDVLLLSLIYCFDCNLKEKSVRCDKFSPFFIAI